MSYAKPVEDRQRRNMPVVLEASPPAPVSAETAAVSTETVEYPRPPSGLSAALERIWHGLWTSPIAQLLDPVSDLPAVTRLWSLYRLGEQLDDAVAANMHAYLDALTRPRSAGEPDEDEDPPAPDDKLIAQRLRVASETRLIEAQLGLSPRSRLALGLALAAGRKAAAGGGLDDVADAANG